MPALAAEDLDYVLEHAREAWGELADARIFITGGTGFFGCWLVETLAWAHDRLGLNSSMTVLTRSPEAFRAKAPHLASHRAVTLLAGDVCDFQFPHGGFTHVVHAATPSSGSVTRDHARMLEILVEGTRRTLDFAVAAGARRFLFTSAGAVYGTQPADMTHVPETYAGLPNTPDPHKNLYGEGKLRAEELCASYSGRLEPVIARCFTFVGPHLPLDIHFAIGNFIRDCLNGQRIEIRGDGTARRSYLYAADLAIWLWTMLARGEAGGIYNVGSEQDVSIAELARTVAAAIRPATEIHVAGVAHAGAPVDRYVPRTARARGELGLREGIGLREAIRRTAEWYITAAARR